MLPPFSPFAEMAAQERIERYLSCLARWSSHINLTGASNAQTAFETLVLPVLGAENYLRGSVIDVGSGNGSPGLILAAFRPEMTFTLLEPRAKRWAFLREAIREMGLTTVTVSRERSEAYSGLRAQTITMRAVGLDPLSLRTLAEPDGQVLVFGGPALTNAERLDLPTGASLQRVCFT